MSSRLRKKMPICVECQKYISSLKAKPPYRIELELWGNDYGHVAFGSCDDLLVSEGFRSNWLNDNMSGLSGFEAVTVVNVVRHQKMAKAGALPSYYRASVVRSRAAIDLDASGFEIDGAVCKECLTGGLLKRAARIRLQPETWEGEDLFIARGLPGTYLASERFKAFFDKHQITSATLIPAEEYSFDFYPGGD